MKDSRKTKEQLIQELEFLRKQNIALEESKKALQEREAKTSQKLASILSPDQNTETLELADIVDAQALQSMMDNFFDLTHIGIAIVDLHGQVLVATGWQDICTKFHRVHPATCKHCLESDTALSSGVPPGTFKIYKCKNNMWDMVTPIILGNKHVGNLFLGQFFFEDELPDYALFRAQAQQYGFDEKAYLAALDRVPRWSRETVNIVMTFYTQFANLISQLSYSNVRLAQTVAERDELLHSLQDSEARFRSYIDYAPTGVFIANEHGHYLEVNPAACKITGYTEKELLSMHILDLLPPESHESAAKHFQQVVETGWASDDTAFTHKEGQKRYWSVDAVRLSPTRFMGFVQDITERKLDEQALKESEANLKEANIAKDKFLSIIAHDLKNPLLGVVSGTEMLKKHLQGVEDKFAQRISQELHKSSQRLFQLLENLLSWSRAQRGMIPYRPHNIDLSSCVNACIHLLHENATQKHINVTSLIEQGNVVYADYVMLETILRNLISNAIKFTPPGGEIRIEAKNHTELVEIAVIDNGVGMHAEKIQRLFNIGEKNISSAGTAGEKGTGLGLILCYEFVKKHRGEIWATSQPGQGSQLRFTLPQGRTPEIEEY